MTELDYIRAVHRREAERGEAIGILIGILVVVVLWLCGVIG